ncbi:conjugal transfer protein TraG, partial [Listeria monocytogenes]|nr:conjugal transfer protein TraG [Listeria monocytogenes]
IIQLEKVYGAQDAETIRGACGNTVYLKSSLGKTNKSISEELGTYEYESKSRSGQTFSLDKHKSESVDDRPLMRPEELALLRKGEMIIYRTMKREDNKGKDITPRPIFIHGKNRILPSYKRLKNWISIKGKSLQTIGLPEEVGKVDLEAITPTDYIPYAKQMHANRPYFPDSFFQSSWENQSPTTFFSEAQRKQIQTLLEKEPNLDIEQNQHLLNPSTMEGFLDNWKLLKQQQFLSDKVYSLILAWIEQGIEASKREEAS